jgi:hypothetical protein
MPAFGPQGAFGVPNPYADIKKRGLETMQMLGQEPTWAERALPWMNPDHVDGQSPAVVDPNNAGAFGYGTQDRMEMRPEQLPLPEQERPWHPMMQGYGVRRGWGI